MSSVILVKVRNWQEYLISGSILEVDESGTILSTSTAPETETEYAISDNVQEVSKNICTLPTLVLESQNFTNIDVITF